jgi:hypothetical protein
MICCYHRKAIEVSLDLAWLTTSLSTTMPAALRGGVVLVGQVKIFV